MHGEIESGKNGWYGIGLGLSAPEIDRLIALLTRLRDDPEQHFNIVRDYSGAGGIGDIELYASEAGTSSNLQLSGFAIEPGSDLSQPGV